jgi:large subunit ribosomal protein L21
MPKYAIVEISGRQFWIQTGKFYNVNRISSRVGTRLNLNRVLLTNASNSILIGKPYLLRIQVKGIILQQSRSSKTIIYKMRPKKKTRKKEGHRQELTKILIQNIYKL